MSTLIKFWILSVLFMCWVSCASAEWSRRYDGPGNSEDSATCISIDPAGNVYVAGWSLNIDNWLSNYVIISYSNDGKRRWVRRYNGPGNGDDTVAAIATDSNGNIYVTGASEGKSSGYDYATIKYDTNGNIKWVRRYNGAENLDDSAAAIASDSKGNIYVTGWSDGRSSGHDYATIKYDTNGNIKWVRRYNGAGNGYDDANALAIDATGNLYITGSSYIDNNDNYDFATIKYDTNGNRKWVQRYNGPGNSDDTAKAISVDRGGNVYITGSSDGNTSSRDFATIKYDTNGNRKWIQRYNGPGNSDDTAKAISVDRGGNVYITGNSGGFATIKYDTNGKRKWVRRYNGGGDLFAYASGIVVDSNGYVYVTGYVKHGYQTCDYTTIRYDKAGNRNYIRYYGDGGHDDIANTIAVDDFDNVYVSGESLGAVSYLDIATIKYDATSWGK